MLLEATLLPVLAVTTALLTGTCSCSSLLLCSRSGYYSSPVVPNQAVLLVIDVVGSNHYTLVTGCVLPFGEFLSKQTYIVNIYGLY